ncbi:hypothetical protein K450DRAFT_274726 [Umbelopsis ramanniana AG]|uniref:Dipeptidyl-peptidase V n=1 Tax=Umbelopsis ramanniana AG TaxID=1314678 RepID=A0AAD5E3J4_UMBRA|nr:uncharacterized protein K450DRAFT_274726 [Umbelopsis ramanniana AG]KAI8576488.1 hypothetical protein K450DRAFT_274726 [Umbelopsis ramanniana AG]
MAITGEARILSPHELVTLPRPGGVATAPSGKRAVFAQSQYNTTADKSTKNLHVVDLENSKIGTVTAASLDYQQDDAFFLDDDHIAFYQTGIDLDVGQVYVLNIRESDAKPYQLTKFPVDVSNFKFYAESKLLAFSAAVYQDGTLEGARAEDEKIQKEKKDSALVYDSLMVRHWDHFTSAKKNNIFIVKLELQDGKYQVNGSPKNLMKGGNLESPVLPFGDAANFDLSPNGKQLAFVSKISGPEGAWETSQHVYLVSTDGNSEPVAINHDIPAAANNPVFAPDGTLAYLQMLEPKYEADRNRIVLYDGKTRTYVAENWDRSPSSLVFSKDSKTIFVTAEEHGHTKIFAIERETGNVKTLTEKHTASSLSVLNGKLVFSLASMNHPNIVSSVDLESGELKTYGVTNELAVLMKGLDMPTPEEFWFNGSLNAKVHGWIIKPTDFDSSKKYPVAFLIHGGPQGSWGSSWSTRWNPQIYAAAGYVTVAINPHGSTGYGQEFCDAIRNNWGSYPYYDLDKGLTYVIENFDFVDADNVFGLGASYGGYMINWINGHSKRFKALVNHDGMFSTINSFYTTDELYFPEREFGGVPFNPFHRLSYERWSPSNYVANWKTPTLVIHGARDYRLVDGEGLATFTALQRQGVPSKLVYFPDENHWVLKPANSLKWHKEVLDWLARWKNSPSPIAEDDNLNVKDSAGVHIDIEQLVHGIRSNLTGPRLELQK